jgi:hypothetical protein
LIYYLLFHLYGDATIAGEGLQNLGPGRDLCRTTPHVTRDLGFPVLSEGPPHSVVSYDTHGDSNPDPHEALLNERT